MNRLDFIDSISGIQYPEMLVNFFDQFIALKKLVEDYGIITVESSTERSINFIILFDSQKNKNTALLNTNTGNVVIYGRSILVSVEDISDKELRFVLQ